MAAPGDFSDVFEALKTFSVTFMQSSHLAIRRCGHFPGPFILQCPPLTLADLCASTVVHAMTEWKSIHKKAEKALIYQLPPLFSYPCYFLSAHFFSAHSFSAHSFLAHFFSAHSFLAHSENDDYIISMISAALPRDDQMTAQCAYSGLASLILSP